MVASVVGAAAGWVGGVILAAAGVSAVVGAVAGGGTAAVAAETGGTVAVAASADGDPTNQISATAAVDPTKLIHIFGKPSHLLDEFVNAQGGHEQAFHALQDAANQALREGKLVPGPDGRLPNGDAGPIINVAGTQIRLLGGRVIDSVVRIATASRIRIMK